MDLVVSCVTESRPAWLDRVELLARSLRAFGGDLAQAPLVVNVVDGIEPSRADRLRRLGAQVRVVERVDARNAFANKLRMLELRHELDFDVLVALDCDVAVAGDPSAFARPDSIGVKPADVDPLSDRHWRRLFGELGIPPPPKLTIATTSGRPMVPYFNSGALFVPRHLCSSLHARWSARHSQLSGLLERDRFLIPPPAHFFLDQLALAAALRELPWHALPVAANFPIHHRVPPAALAGSPEPALLHYHKEIDARGFLLRPRSRAASAAVERVNREHARAHGLSYGAARARPRLDRMRESAVRQLWRVAASRRVYHAPAIQRLREEARRSRAA